MVQVLPVLRANIQNGLEGDTQAVLNFTVVVNYDAVDRQIRTWLHVRDQVIGWATRLIHAAHSRSAVHTTNRISRTGIKGRCEVRMVEQVEYIHAELQTNSFADLPVFLQAEVGVDEARPVAEAGRLIAHRSDSLAYDGERVGIVDVRPLRSAGTADAGYGRSPVRTWGPRRTLVAGAVQGIQLVGMTQWRVRAQDRIIASRHCREVF